VRGRSTVQAPQSFKMTAIDLDHRPHPTNPLPRPAKNSPLQRSNRYRSYFFINAINDAA
jgi:hypothetical protein